MRVVAPVGSKALPSLLLGDGLGDSFFWFSRALFMWWCSFSWPCRTSFICSSLSLSIQLQKQAPTYKLELHVRLVTRAHTEAEVWTQANKGCTCSRHKFASAADKHNSYFSGEKHRERERERHTHTHTHTRARSQNRTTRHNRTELLPGPQMPA